MARLLVLENSLCPARSWRGMIYPTDLGSQKRFHRQFAQPWPNVLSLPEHRCENADIEEVVATCDAP